MEPLGVDGSKPETESEWVASREPVVESEAVAFGVANRFG